MTSKKTARRTGPPFERYGRHAMRIQSQTRALLLAIGITVGCSSNDSTSHAAQTMGMGSGSSPAAGGSTGTGGVEHGTGGGHTDGNGGANIGAGGSEPHGAGGRALDGAGGQLPGAGDGTSSGGSAGAPNSGTGGQAGSNAALGFGPYKDTGINMNWNTNVISTNVSGTPAPLSDELVKNGGSTITLAFATGECGTENWAGVAGAAMASANVPLLTKAKIRYIVSTGGAAGSFTCGTDAGFTTFLDRWMSPNLIGVDLDIEAGQTEAQILELTKRIKAAHGAHPTLKFSLTLATLANNDGAGAAQSVGAANADSFNVHGDNTLAAVKSTFGFSGDPASFPAYVTVNLMTMDYGAPGKGVCVVSGGACQMGQSAIQAAYNLRDHWGVPFANIELTPMIGGNDVQGELFSLADVATVSSFAIDNGLAGVHYWSLDRDTDCPVGSASPTCNSAGAGYAGAYGYLKAFLHSGLR